MAPPELDQLYRLALAQRRMLLAALKTAKVALNEGNPILTSRALAMIYDTERALIEQTDLLPMPGAT